MLKMRNMVCCGEMKMDSGEEENSPLVRSIVLELEIPLTVVYSMFQRLFLVFLSRYNNLLFSLSAAAQFLSHKRCRKGQQTPHILGLYTGRVDWLFSFQQQLRFTNSELGGSQYKQDFWVFLSSWGFSAPLDVSIWCNLVVCVSDCDSVRSVKQRFRRVKATLFWPVERKMLSHLHL